MTDDRADDDFDYLDEMFGLVEQPQGGVPGAVGSDGHDVFQLLQAVSQVSAAVLFQLIMSGSGKMKIENFKSSSRFTPMGRGLEQQRQKKQSKQG